MLQNVKLSKFIVVLKW